MSKRSRTILTLAQKKELCQKKENNPHLKHIEIANEYGIGESTVSEILKAKDRWLAFEDDSLQKKSVLGNIMQKKRQTRIYNYISFA